VVDVAAAVPLSHRATAGFLERVDRSKLKFDKEFITDLKGHLTAMDLPASAPQTRSAARRKERAAA
jgi:hypothetical protein